MAELLPTSSSTSLDRNSNPPLASSSSSSSSSSHSEEEEDLLELQKILLQDGDEEPKLSLVQKLGYGFGEVAPYTGGVIYSFFLQTFLLEVAEVPPLWTGLLLLIGQLWDAVNDPLIGYLSDRTTSSMGRRRPWLLWGSAPFAFAYFLLWQVPPWVEKATWLAVLWYLVVIFNYNTTFTCVAVPYRALTPDLTRDYDERTSLTTYRQFLALVSGVICTFVHSTIITSTHTYKGGYTISAIVFGTIIVFPPWVTFLTNKERYIPKKEYTHQQGIFQYFRDLVVMFKNRAFLIVTLLFLCCWLAINLITNNLYLYVKYVLEMEHIFSWVLLSVQATAAIFLFFWSWVSRKIGKVNTYYAGTTVWVVVQIGFFFFKSGVDPITIYITGCLAGVGVSIGFLIPWSMLPDAIDVDELETGRRREGMFYSVFGLFHKIGQALGVAASSWALGFAGYTAPPSDSEDIQVQQPDSVIWTLRVMVGPLPAVLLLLSFVVVRFYPITRENHGRLREELAAREKALEEDQTPQPS